MEGVDFSSARPSGSCLVSNGKRFAGRYFGAGSAPKHASKAECAALSAAGLEIFAIVEGYANDANLGYSKGVEQAHLGHNAAVAAGMPSTRPLYFAVDFDASTAQLSNVAQYMRGAASVIGAGRVGAYGGYRTMEYLAAHGLVAWYFQTYAWSSGRWSSHNHIEQYSNNHTVCGGAVDLCRSTRPDFGGWRVGVQSFGAAPATAPSSTAETPWEFGDTLNALASQVGEVGNTSADTARIIEGL